MSEMRKTGARNLALGTAGLGGMSVTAMMAPEFGAAVAGVVLAIGVIVVLSALFGPNTITERAFRLLRWLTDRHEPPMN